MEVIEIPYGKLEPATLQRILEEFVSREGTDYGHSDFSLDQKVAQVMEQIIANKAIITFDPKTESCNIVPND